MGEAARGSEAAPSPSDLSEGQRAWIRLLLSPLLLGAVLGVLWFHDATGAAWATQVVLALAGGAAGFELARLLRQGDAEAHPWLATAGAAVLAGHALLAPEDAARRGELRSVLVAVLLVVLLLRHLLDTRRAALSAMASTLVPWLYIGLLLAFTGELGAGPQGARVLVWVVLTSKASDIGGWLVGKPFGRHKLVPTVSPGKSWEGLAGGLALSLLAAALLPGPLGLEAASWALPRRLLFGLAVGGASILAGVTWSGWKRRVGVKDSSPLIPEMGGVIDMVDSLLLAGPVAWAWLRLGL